MSPGKRSLIKREKMGMSSHAWLSLAQLGSVGFWNTLDYFGDMCTEMR